MSIWAGGPGRTAVGANLAVCVQQPFALHTVPFFLNFLQQVPLQQTSPARHWESWVQVHLPFRHVAWPQGVVFNSDEQSSGQVILE
jgi:hypothetical protein